MNGKCVSWSHAEASWNYWKIMGVSDFDPKTSQSSLGGLGNVMKCHEMSVRIMAKPQILKAKGLPIFPKRWPEKKNTKLNCDQKTSPGLVASPNLGGESKRNPSRNHSVYLVYINITNICLFIHVILVFILIICGYFCAYLLFDQQLFHPETAILGEICGFRHTFTNSKFI